MVFGIGGSSQESRSKTEKESFGIDVTTQALDPGQQAMQNTLFQQFFPALNVPGLNYNMLGMAGQNQQQLANRSAYGAQYNAGQASQAAQQYNLFGNAGIRDLYGFANQNNPYLQEQIRGLAQDYGEMFREQILPGVRGQFTGANQRGGSRQGISEALGAQRMMDSFGQQANNLRFGAYGQQQQAAAQVAQLGQQGQYQNQALSGQLNLGRMGQAGQFAQGYYGMQPEFFGTQFQPFQIGAQIVGQPSVLTQGLGMDYETMTSTSRGSGQSLNLGIG